MGLVFFANSAEHETWPYPGFDCTSRREQLHRMLREGCPGIEFVPVTIAVPEDLPKALALTDSTDGLLLYAMTLNWGLTRALVELAELGKPTLVADEFLGGCGMFLVGYSQLRRRGAWASGVSTTRDEDLVAVARQFAGLRRPGMTREAFGPGGQENRFRVRTLHNRDPRGVCAQSFLPEGYMTTSFRTNVERKQLVIHQARTAGSLDADRGCRTQLVDEVRGDIEKLFRERDRFGWHRVTSYGDIREPVLESARALGLTVIEEA